MIVLPAIDVLAGRCVRLAEGERDRITVEGGDPAAAASSFVRDGADYVHLVDLDGAFAGRPSEGLVRAVATSAAPVPLQAGGGFRTPEAIEAALADGAARVIVGTAALTALEELVGLFGDRLVVAVDARDGRVVVDGWTADADIEAGELARRCAGAGAARLLVTSTRRDGSLAGPDTALVEEVLAAGLPVVAAGGIASLDDLRTLRDLGCEGAVVGSALWRGRFTLRQALAAVAAP